MNVVTKSGSNSSARHGVRVPPQRRAGRAGRTRSRRRRRRPRRRRSNGTSTATRPAARSGRTSCSSCRISKGTGTQTVPELSPCRRRRCGAATSRNCWPASGRSTRRPVSATGDRRPDAVHRRRHDADLRCRSPATSFRPAASNGISKKLLEFYPEPNNGTAALSATTTSRCRTARSTKPVHAADGFRPELRIDLDGPLQLRPARTK